MTERPLAGKGLLLCLSALGQIGACQAANMLPIGPGPDCPKVEVQPVLHVDPADPRQIWATDLATSGMATARSTVARRSMRRVG